MIHKFNNPLIRRKYSHILFIVIAKLIISLNALSQTTNNFKGNQVAKDYLEALLKI